MQFLAMTQLEKSVYRVLSLASEFLTSSYYGVTGTSVR
jgi:hypothetical protein